MRLDLDPWAIFGCNIAKWTILCIVVHFQPVITNKITSKWCQRASKTCDFDAKFFWEGGTAPSPSGEGTPLPTPHPLGAFGASILTPHSEILPTLLVSKPMQLVMAAIRNKPLSQEYWADFDEIRGRWSLLGEIGTGTREQLQENIQINVSVVAMSNGSRW